jgi:hypothetical protein
VLFRVFFNARFYYPVLAVFFLDLGLSATQYTLLHFAWALAIVAVELPFGVLDDSIDARRSDVRVLAMARHIGPICILRRAIRLSRSRQLLPSAEFSPTARRDRMHTIYRPAFTSFPRCLCEGEVSQHNRQV